MKADEAAPRNFAARRLVMVSEAPVLREAGVPVRRAFRLMGWESNHLDRAKRIRSDRRRSRCDPGAPDDPMLAGWGGISAIAPGGYPRSTPNLKDLRIVTPGEPRFGVAVPKYQLPTTKYLFSCERSGPR
jgi:hypothetical protein